VEKPFDLEVVDALVARAVHLSLGGSFSDPAEPWHRAERIAGQILSSYKCAEISGFDASILVSAGFRLATKLCCRILSDPLRTHRGGAKRDVNSILTWMNRRRQEGS
jgi:hypothetical protein